MVRDSSPQLSTPLIKNNEKEEPSAMMKKSLLSQSINKDNSINPDYVKIIEEKKSKFMKMGSSDEFNLNLEKSSDKFESRESREWRDTQTMTDLGKVFYLPKVTNKKKRKTENQHAD